MCEIAAHTDTIYSMSFNYDGSLLSTTSKDKILRVIDPRKGEVVQQGESHKGAKASRGVWCGTTNKIFTTGFSKMNERQYGVWDPVRTASKWRRKGGETHTLMRKFMRENTNDCPKHFEQEAGPV